MSADDPLGLEVAMVVFEAPWPDRAIPHHRLVDRFGMSTSGQEAK